MDGVEAAGIIQRQLGTPVLFVTAYTLGELERDDALPATFDLLVKPIVEQELIRKLNQLLGNTR
jgi:CheY-like chemotaxis protein